MRKAGMQLQLFYRYNSVQASHNLFICLIVSNIMILNQKRNLDYTGWLKYSSIWKYFTKLMELRAKKLFVDIQDDLIENIAQVGRFLIIRKVDII